MTSNKLVGFVIVFIVNYLIKSAKCSDPYHGTLENELNSNGRSFIKERITPEQEMKTEYWFEKAQNCLKKRVNQKQNNGKAKNIIFFLGDGMSIATLTAARILKGQRNGLSGEEAVLTMEKFPHTGLSKTYCTNAQTADSACSATAYLTGVKTNLRLIGVNAKVDYLNCLASKDLDNHVESIALWAQQAGKSTGIVTTTTITHASPSGNYAHVPSRHFESDFDIIKAGVLNPKDCLDIATQLIENEPGKHFDVMMGGGQTKFIPFTQNDTFGSKGERRDGKDLIQKWKTENPEGVFVSNLEELNNLDYNNTKKVFGLFHSSHLDYNARKKVLNPSQPRLKDMTASAIKMLQRNPKGYYVFIEGGRIDHGHHQNSAGYALDETIEFDEAIQTALEMTNDEDTLIVVTADHSHTMSMAGYPGRGNPILGLNEYDLDMDGVPYSVLNYAVGPKQYIEVKDNTWKRIDLTEETHDFIVKPSYIKKLSGHHAGEDVAIFARGPQSHLFSGTMEQNVIPHLMAYAACIGKGAKLCEE
ncbi:alkaline phosphatase [Lucilia cuprina]|uniref:alkaline phosphatase n=1 Tax=Lucilia cuprina TaxID=7375 RepID=UPI001F060DF5|nr:alkaline phosphatase [Lucilia cuprina]